MESILTLRDLYRSTSSYAGKTVKLCGWVRNRRASKAFGFIMLSDGTFFQPVQVVITEALDNFAEIAKINIGAALIVEGRVELTPTRSSPLRSKPAACLWKVPRRRTSPFSPSVIRWNTCGP